MSEKSGWLKTLVQILFWIGGIVGALWLTFNQGKLSEKERVNSEIKSLENELELYKVVDSLNINELTQDLKKSTIGLNTVINDYKNLGLSNDELKKVRDSLYSEKRIKDSILAKFKEINEKYETLYKEHERILVKNKTITIEEGESKFVLNNTISLGLKEIDYNEIAKVNLDNKPYSIEIGKQIEKKTSTGKLLITLVKLDRSEEMCVFDIRHIQ